MKYENRKTGKIATLDQMNEKFKTVLLVFEDGTNTTISTSTLKRWWKEIPEEETKEEVKPLIDLDNPITDEDATANGMVTGDEALEQAVVDPDAAYVAEQTKKEVVGAQGDFTVVNDFENNDVYIEVGEDVAGDGTPLAEVGKEIAQQAKEKAKKARKETRSKTDHQTKTSTETEKLVQFIIDEAQKIKASPYYREKQPSIINFKIDGTSTVSFNIIRSKKSGVCLNTKSKLISGEIADKMKVVNHCFDRSYKIVELNDSEMVFIREVLQSISNCAVKKSTITKNDKKAKKGED